MVQVLRVSGVHGTIRYELDTSYGEELRLPFQPATSTSSEGGAGWRAVAALCSPA